MQIVQWLEGFIHNPRLITFLVSMIPVIELRGAVPIGVGLGLPVWEALLISIVGNMVPVPFIVLFIRRIFLWIRRHMPKLEGLVTRLEQKAEKHRGNVTNRKFWGLFVLVAIPLPGTGAWTGALVAALMDLRLKRSVPAIFLGVVTAGILVTGITYGFRRII